MQQAAVKRLGDKGYLTKLSGPAVTAAELGPVDVVLVSHDLHPDNLDDSGREFALAAPLLVTGPRRPVGSGRRPRRSRCGRRRAWLAATDPGT